MFGILEGIFGFIRPGILGNSREKLNDMIDDLESTPEWSKAVALATESPKNPEKLAREFEALLWHIKDTKNTVSVTLVRRYMQMVEQMQKLAGGGVKVIPPPKPSTPEPPVKPAPTVPVKPKIVPTSKPTAKPTALPPAPPGIKCPHYTKASAFPPNWDDPAAEQRYLDNNPDVKTWVDAMKKRKELKGKLNALWHYRCYGAKENRNWAGLGRISLQMPGFLR